MIDSKKHFQENLNGIKPLSGDAFEMLYNISKERQLVKGENILEEGKVCNKIIYIVTGYLRHFINRDGIEVNTDFILEGNFTTNLKSLQSTLPSDVTIQAGEDSIVYEFHKNDLLALYKDAVEIELLGKRILERLLIAQEEHANWFKLYTPAERYQKLLANRPELLQRISLSQLSSYLGVARETLSRIRSIK